MQYTIGDFAERLLEEKGLMDLEPDILKELKKDLEDRVEDRINAAILDRMPADKLDDFEKILESGSDKEVQKYTKEAIPDLEEVIAAELMNFRGIYLGATV